MVCSQREETDPEVHQVGQKNTTLDELVRRMVGWRPVLEPPILLQLPHC